MMKSIYLKSGLYFQGQVILRGWLGTSDSIIRILFDLWEINVNLFEPRIPHA